MTKTLAKRKCGCKGRSGETKRNFSSRHAALGAAFRMPGFPKPYPCPKIKGRYHLTHA